MPLIDDLSIPDNEKDRSRRAFLGILGTGALAAAGAGTGVTAIRYLWPEVLFEEESRFRLGRPDEIPVGILLALPAQKIYVVHGSQGFYALSATCTHLGCLTKYEAELNRIFCPCHGSRFSPEGHVVAGPAPRPLPRLQLTIEDGFLVVDVSKIVDANFVLKVGS